MRSHFCVRSDTTDEFMSVCDVHRVYNRANTIRTHMNVLKSNKFNIGFFKHHTPGLFYVQMCYKFERMIKLLVRHHNTMLKHNHFPCRWLTFLDAMIEIRKGNLTNKLSVKK